MRILIDIGHPAHVHLFKNLARKLQLKGHSIHFTVRDKEFEIDLLKHEGLSYTSFGRHYKSKILKIWGLFKFNWLILITSLKFKPDIFLSHGSVYNSLASFLLRKPNIVLEDTGNIEQVRLYLPFVNVILTSTSFKKSYGNKQIRYEGYHELAYLHPKYFTPSSYILDKLGISKDEQFVIIRLVSWNASHDKGQNGISITDLRSIIGRLSFSYKIFISSECKLHKDFEQYKIKLLPEDMHNALAFAKLYIGEGATMASECAMLGTPAIYVNSLESDIINQQENSGLLYHIRNSNDLLDKIDELTSSTDFKEKFQYNRDKILNETIDLTEMLGWFVEDFPESLRIFKLDPQYQKRFKF